MKNLSSFLPYFRVNNFENFCIYVFHKLYTWENFRVLRKFLLKFTIELQPIYHVVLTSHTKPTFSVAKAAEQHQVRWTKREAGSEISGDRKSYDGITPSYTAFPRRNRHHPAFSSDLEVDNKSRAHDFWTGSMTISECQIKGNVKRNRSCDK